MIIQNAAADVAGRTDVTFTVAKSELARVRTIMDGLAQKVGAQGVRYEEQIAKISIVGLGMRSHAGVAAKMFRILAAFGINIQAISTSEIKVSCLVDGRYAELAQRALHDGFELHDTRALPAGSSARE
jgi:aspartate kinase